MNTTGQPQPLTAADIACLVGGEVVGNPGEVVTGMAGIREAQPGDVTFVASAKCLPAVKTTRASVIILDKQSAADVARTLIRVDDPAGAFARLVAQLAPEPPRYSPGIHPTAIIAASAKLGSDVSIQPHVVIE